MNTAVVTRFAPSPTGALHIGGVRTALFNYLYARRQGGTFILRIEDTDKERSRPEYETNIIETLTWLGIRWDALYRQSERTDLYRHYLERLVETGAAYLSQEEPQKEGERSEVIRFKNPNKVVSFEDAVLGTISFDTTSLGNFVIAKDMALPLYHLAVVVDDHEMAVTHVIRGQEHISNTPRQILLMEALGFERPLYAHLPLILAPDKSKLSKRHGAIPAIEYRDQGYLPEALINFLALIGWHPEGDGEREVYTLPELIDRFDLHHIQKAGGVFDTHKLQWQNRQHLKLYTPEERLKCIEAWLPRHTEGGMWDTERLSAIEPLISERISTLDEIRKLFATGEFDYFFRAPSYVSSMLKTPVYLSETRTLVETIPEGEWTGERVKETVWAYATEQGRGKVLWPLRVALSGREKSPDPFTIAGILGKEETVKRLEYAIQLSK